MASACIGPPSGPVLFQACADATLACNRQHSADRRNAHRREVCAVDLPWVPLDFGHVRFFMALLLLGPSRGGGGSLRSKIGNGRKKTTGEDLKTAGRLGALPSKPRVVGSSPAWRAAETA